MGRSFHPARPTTYYPSSRRSRRGSHRKTRGRGPRPCQGMRMVSPVLIGQRLRLVPANPGHLEFFRRLNADEQVMRHVSSRPYSQSETDAEWWRRLGPRSDTDRGIGYWTGFLGGQPIGWWGLGYDGARPAAGELGFRLDHRHWRQGLGSEGASLLLHHGFFSARIAHVWAGTVRANAASRATSRASGLPALTSRRPGF